MSCIERGRLMAFVDGELSPPEENKLQAHLEQCSHCRENLEELRKAQEISHEALQNYCEPLSSLEADTEKGWNRFKFDLTSYYATPKNWKGVFSMQAKARYLAAGIAIAVLVGVFSAFPGTRSLAADFLNVFRMERVQVVELDRESIKQFTEEMQDIMPRDLEKYIDINRQIAGEPERIAPREATARAGFKVVLPEKLAGAELSEVVLRPQNKATIKPHVRELNDFMASAGHQQFLPPELEGTEIAITIPRSVSARYENGPVLTQTLEPEIAVSGDVGLEEIRNIVAANPVLPEDLRTALLSVEDWRRTMVIPDMNGTSREVAVNGEQGVFISPPGEKEAGARRAVLIWPQNNIWMTLSGDFALQEALKTAETLR